MRLGNLSATFVLLGFGMRAAMADDVVISGTVVNGITGDPIPKASVVPQGLAEQMQAGQPKQVRVTTTTGLVGEFRFTAPKGHYRPMASKAGFSGRWFREAPNYQTGNKSEENLRIPLFPFGVPPASTCYSRLQILDFATRSPAYCADVLVRMVQARGSYALRPVSR